jgi:hypothetical protein
LKEEKKLPFCGEKEKKKVFSFVFAKSSIYFYFRCQCSCYLVQTTNTQLFVSDLFFQQIKILSWEMLMFVYKESKREMLKS